MKLNNFAQFVFILLFVGIVIAQYFVDKLSTKEIPISVILFIGSVAAGLKDLPDFINSFNKKDKGDKR